MPTTQRQRRRGTTAQHASFTGALGEVTLDTDRDGLVVHDGAKAGGFPIPTSAEVQVQAMRAASASGTDTLTASLTPPLVGYAKFLKVVIEAANNNTGPATLNIDSQGAVDIQKLDRDGVKVDLEADDLVGGRLYELTHDGADFVVASGLGGGGGGGLAHLSSVVLSAQSQVDFETNFADFDNHRFIFQDIISSQNDVYLACRLKIDGSYQTASYLWIRTDIVNTATPSQNIQDSPAVDSSRIAITTGGIRSASGDSAAAVLDVLGVNDTGKAAILQSRYTSRSNFTHHGSIGGLYNGSPTSHAVTGIRFMMNAGNLAGGKIHHYGFDVG